jgi:hypothetical protein
MAYKGIVQGREGVHTQIQYMLVLIRQNKSQKIEEFPLLGIILKVE